ncbi:MAG: translation initiation factor IF-3 [Akkermansiaceae bacterium]|nr:translation initiation factor IF-3 [Akkermansiaceae bacterium]
MPAPQKNNNPGNRPNKREQNAKAPQTRVNDRIRAPRVRVVTATGEQLGVMSTRDALAKAKEIGLDLVEVAPNADPPVCRLIDYGKYKYMLAKQQKNNKTKTVRMKEIKLRIGTDVNDYNVKMARSEQFLDHGHKVRFQLRFRGRENAHQQLGLEVMAKVVEDLRTMGKIDQAAKLAGNTVTMVLTPLPQAQRVKKFKKYEEEDFDTESSEFDASDDE